MTFVVFGVPHDPHICRVGAALRKKGVDVRVLPSIPPAGAAELSWVVSGAGSSSSPTLGLARASGNEDSPVDGLRTLVWMRNKAQIDYVHTQADQATVLCIKERSAWMKGWIRTTGARWINPLTQALEAEVKLTQLHLATSLGMPIPRTIISNCRNDVRSFVSEGGDFVIKALATAVVPSHNPDLSNFFVYTSDLTSEDVEDSCDEEWALAPVIVQEKIEKSYELRVIQIGDHALAVRIDPEEAGQTDYRKTSPANTHAFCRAPTQLVEFGAKYLNALGLDMGVFDYAVTVEGKYVFFECNPSGQWAWMEGVEDDDDHEISKFVADQFHKLYLSLV